MRSSFRPFLVVAVVGLTVLALAQTPVHAQFRRVPPRTIVVPPVYYPPVSPVYYPPVARTPIVVPPISTYTRANQNVLPGMNLNQLAMYSVLSMDPTLAPLLNAYNPYRSVYVTPVYPTIPYATTAYPYAAVGAPGFPYNPYNYYNPYFAAFGFHP